MARDLWDTATDFYDEKIDPWVDHYNKLWKYRDDVINSLGATILLISDVTGIQGEFGRHDIFDPDGLDAIINSHPDAGQPGPSADEDFWDNIHRLSGLGLGLTGMDKESATNILRDWERIEPTIWSGWNPVHQGRNLFEFGEIGIERDMATGLSGYEHGEQIHDKVINAINNASEKISTQIRDFFK